MKNNLLKLPLALMLLGFLGFGAGDVLAYRVEDLPNVEVEGDVVMGPGKVEVNLNPGEVFEKTIYFTNRTGRKVDFTVNVEDFMGSRDINTATVFMGERKGPYSLKDYLHPDTWQFTLEHGQRIALPVKIQIPQDAEPGGLYGVVFATAAPPDRDLNANPDAAAVIGIAARVGCLFFVKVNGNLNEEGMLNNFSTAGNKVFFEKGPIDFQFTYENNGSAHLDPYGTVEINNLTGRKVAQIEVPPYFAMPDSERLNEAKWNAGFLLGKYTATLFLNRGYGDIVDSQSISFWVLPWRMMLAGGVALAVIVFFLGWLFSHFKFRMEFKSK